jgi:hypothetical protein
MAYPPGHCIACSILAGFPFFREQKKERPKNIDTCGCKKKWINSRRVAIS